MTRTSFLTILAAAAGGAAATLALAAPPAPDSTATLPPDAVAQADTVPAVTPAPRAAGNAAHGIALQGRWTIEVREADGQVVSRRVFQNAYTDPSDFIPKLVAGEAAAGFLGISLEGTPHICQANDDQSPTPCAIVPEVNGVTFSSEWTNLTSSRDGKTIALQGHVIAQQDGSVTTVATLMGQCPASMAPDACTGQVYAELTSHSLDSAIAVVSGQQVVARVQLSFGPAN